MLVKRRYLKDGKSINVVMRFALKPANTYRMNYKKRVVVFFQKVALCPRPVELHERPGEVCIKDRGIRSPPAWQETLTFI